MEGIVVLFDFDKTVIDVDSDNWVFDELGFTDLFYQLLSTMPWNSAMNMLMKEMHEKGVTSDDIVKVLQRIPIHPKIVPTIKAIHSAGCCLRIVSDANMFFIDTILNHLGLRSCFSSIESNPGYVDQQGRLRIQPHQHDFAHFPHGCTNPNCPPNMCKGFVVEKIVSEQRDKKFIYLGDGKGDYCPTIKLRDVDIVMPRKNFPVWDLIFANPKLINAQVYEWVDGGELQTVLLNAVRTLSSSEEEEAIDKVIVIPTVTGPPTLTHPCKTIVDCKLDTGPTSTSCESFQKALRVPY